MTGVAVKVTLLPAQMLLADAAILKLAVTLWLTTIVIEFEVAGLPLEHVALEVITQVIKSLLFREPVL